jgi:tRNA(fMet)-specific endonuclease VapC
MRLAIDSNVFIDIARGRSDLARAIEEASNLFLPLPVLAELRVGFRGSRTPDRAESLLDRFLEDHDVVVLSPDEATTHVYADIAIELRRAGTAIASNDIWIAAITIQHGCSLATSDADFDLIPRLPKVKFGPPA